MKKAKYKRLSEGAGLLEMFDYFYSKIDLPSLDTDGVFAITELYIELRKLETPEQKKVRIKDTILEIKKNKMNKNKVTDLENFVLEQIIRPYQSMIWGEERIDKLPISIDDIPGLIKKNPKWWGYVKDRINRIGLYFPPYIKHPLVELINEQE